MNSNNPLAVELESENDAACEDFFVGHEISLRLKRRLERDNKKDLFK
jgi:hypothetical protein